MGSDVGPVACPSICLVKEETSIEFFHHPKRGPWEDSAIGRLILDVQREWVWKGTTEINPLSYYKVQRSFQSETKLLLYYQVVLDRFQSDQPARLLAMMD